jgi:hypothetical protein
MVETEGDYRAGESLVRMDLATRQRVGVLVRPRKDQKIMFAVSPTLDQVAYVQQPRLGGGEPAIVIMTIDGVPIDNVTLSRDEKVTALSWGALPASVRIGR